MPTAAEISWDDLKRMIFAHSEQLRETDRLIRELRESSKETDRRMQETDRLIRELRESGNETDRRMQETDRLIRELRESGKETDRRMKETDASIKTLRQEMGRLGNRLGEFVEGFVEPTVVKLFQDRGLPVHQVLRRLEALDDAGELICEVDLLVIDTDVGVAVECKSHAGVADVREHVERLEKFKAAFPRFADLKLQGALAAMHWTREAQRLADKEGLWVLAQNAEIVEVKNDARFIPKVW